MSENLCQHFGHCGGCRYQDTAYNKQLEIKAETLAEHVGDAWPQPIHVTPSPDLWFYRNKIELKFDRMQYEEPPPKDFKRPTVLGFRQKGRWYSTFDLEECRIFSPVLKELMPEIRKWYRDGELEYFNNRNGEGLLKHLVVREGKHTSDKLLIVITGPGKFPKQDLVDAVLRGGKFTSIYHGIQYGTGDVALADEMELLHGKEVLSEELTIPDDEQPRHLKFEIPPFGFFQVNPPATELLYGAIRRRVKEVGPKLVYDLYGGSGGIAFSVSDLVPEIISIESFEPASKQGDVNAELNGITNVRFETAPVEKWLGQAIKDDSFVSDSLAILDPPRAAMHPKALNRIIELAPKEIIYVSCNPKLFGREMEAFLHHYELVNFEAFDLFPHTPHVEALAFLRRKTTG